MTNKTLRKIEPNKNLGRKLRRIGYSTIIAGAILFNASKGWYQNNINTYNTFSNSNPSAIASADSLRSTQNRIWDLCNQYNLVDSHGNTNILDIQNAQIKHPEFKAKYDSLGLKFYQLSGKDSVPEALEQRTKYMNNSSQAMGTQGASATMGLIGLASLSAGIINGIANKRKKRNQ